MLPRCPLQFRGEYQRIDNNNKFMEIAVSELALGNPLVAVPSFNFNPTKLPVHGNEPAALGQSPNRRGHTLGTLILRREITYEICDIVQRERVLQISYVLRVPVVLCLILFFFFSFSSNQASKTQDVRKRETSARCTTRSVQNERN